MDTKVENTKQTNKLLTVLDNALNKSGYKILFIDQKFTQYRNGLKSVSVWNDGTISYNTKPFSDYATVSIDTNAINNWQVMFLLHIAGAIDIMKVPEFDVPGLEGMVMGTPKALTDNVPAL